MPAIEPAIAVGGRVIVVTTPIIISVVVTMVVSRPVATTVIRITITIIGITITIVGVIPTIISAIISAIPIRWITITEGHSPSRVSPSHSDTPAKGTSGIPVHIGVIGIIVVPTIIVIGESSQIGRVIIVCGILIIIIDNHRSTLLTVLS
jgi:hypothetical protein